MSNETRPKNWETLPIAERWRMISGISKEDAERLEQEALKRAYRLRDELSGMPFYAKKAAKWAARTGDPMAYWIDLQASQATLDRPSLKGGHED